MIGKVWRGNAGLAVTYWLYFALIVGVIFGTAIPALALQDADPGLVLIYFLLFLVMYVAVAIAVWRAASKYTGPKLWAWLARIATLVGLLRIIAGFVSGVNGQG
jgi:hypothetical protein